MSPNSNPETRHASQPDQSPDSTVAPTAADAAAVSAEDPLPLDVVFELLSNQRRRRVLAYLDSSDESTTLGALAERLASIENDKPERALSSSERKRVYVCLYQCHLPKMDDADVIEFDQDRKTVEIGANAGYVLGFLPDRESGQPANRSLTETLAAAASVLGGGSQ